VPYFQAADVALCPIEHGGGTKIKVWDALAAGLPTVVFPETMQGEVRHGEQVWVAEKTEDALVAAVSRMLDDGETAGRLGATGRAFVVAHHDWKDLADGLEAALLSILTA
jgi:glycosyltransferase involved in cell wall biosynthesis